MTTNLNLEKILKKIKFKVLPEDNIRKKIFYRLKKKIFKILNKEKYFIDSQTLFSDIDESDQITVKELLRYETMSRISVGFLINQICKTLNEGQIYLNIGVWRGFSMFSGMINTECEVIGVDNFSFDYIHKKNSKGNLEESNLTKKYFFESFNKIKKNNHYFHNLDYKKFFYNWEKEKKGINFYYYDGEHSYKNQLENLEIADNFLVKESITVVDDFNEQQVQDATYEFIKKKTTKYRIIKELKTANKFIHPSFANGLIFLEKIN